MSTSEMAYVEMRYGFVCIRNRKFWNNSGPTIFVFVGQEMNEIDRCKGLGHVYPRDGSSLPLYLTASPKPIHVVAPTIYELSAIDFTNYHELKPSAACSLHIHHEARPVCGCLARVRARQLRRTNHHQNAFD